MKSLPIIVAIVCLALAGCSSRSDEAYARLLELAGIQDGHAIRRIEFLKTSGIDPYYLAKIEVSGLEIDRVPELFRSPSDWHVIPDRFVSVDTGIEWWRPQDMKEQKIWAPKTAQSPSYVEVVAGRSGATVVLYVAWLKTANFQNEN